MVTTSPPLLSDQPALYSKSVTHCTRAVLPAMRDRGWGRLVTISSGMAVHSQTTGYSQYGSAKAGALSLMRHIATEFGPSGITANAVVLGLISEEDNEMFRSLAARLPVRRRGTPEDLVALCVFRPRGRPAG